MKDGVQERPWESADGMEKTAQIVIPQIKVKLLLVEMHGVSSGGYLGVNKIINKVRKSYYWLLLRSDVERFYKQCDNCAAS